PGVLHHVVLLGDVPGALVKVQRDRVVVVVHIVVFDHRAGVGGQVVDAAAVVHGVLGVEDQVAGDGVVFQGRRGRVDGLVVVGAAVLVVLAAADVVHAPAPADVDAVVRQIVDLVVGDRRLGDVGGEDGRGLLVIGARVRYQVVADRDVLVGHRRVAWVVGVGLHAADHDAAARDVTERVAVDGDIAGAKTGSARVGVRVIADAEAGLPELTERVVAERDVRGRGHLDRRGHLAPVLPGGLEEVAAGEAAAERGLLPVAGDERAALLVGVALAGAWPQPGRPGE